MTRDEIAQAMQDSAGSDWGNEAHFQRFAQLILEHERKAFVKAIEDEFVRVNRINQGLT